MNFEKALSYLLKGHKIYRDGMEEEGYYYQYHPSVGSFLLTSSQEEAADANLGQIGYFRKGYFLDEASFSSSDVLAEDWFIIGIPQKEEEDEIHEETVQSDLTNSRKTKSKTPATDSE